MRAAATNKLTDQQNSGATLDLDIAEGIEEPAVSTLDSVTVYVRSGDTEGQRLQALVAVLASPGLRQARARVLRQPVVLSVLAANEEVRRQYLV